MTMYYLISLSLDSNLTLTSSNKRYFTSLDDVNERIFRELNLD